ncbi:protein yellow-like isoform X1 [Biomphalaria pfeifferi]|uniref:Protein yellow-like isoform X1 n=1 Tax=Biomphalaria pfeifferi TaxID=112525 RepID=A0AAD8FJA0_BIOPF|nr:protein yellow-like isoform X1 [Biomphalaria pfeifferi]
MLPTFIVVAVFGLYVATVVECRNRLTQRYSDCSHSNSKDKSTDGPTTVHEWVSLAYDWPCDWVEMYYKSKGWYDPAASVLSGIDVYKEDIFVTVQRISSAVPSGLNKVVTRYGKSLLRPYPDLLFNEVGNCSKLQYPLSVTIDPNTGFMYVIDIGKIGLGPVDDGCPAKLVVLNINQGGSLVRSHNFPESVVPKRTNLVNDIVLDYASDNKVRYAYITESSHQQIVVFDFMSNLSWAFHDDTMATDEDRVVTINNAEYPVDVSVDGIAIDSRSEYVYYCSVGSKNLYQVPTLTLRNSSANFTAQRRLVGKKISNSDGIVFGQRNLYYGALAFNAVYRWDVEKDMRTSSLSNVSLLTETRVAQDDVRGRWVESLKLDTQGYLWFTTTRLHEFFAGKLDTSGRNGANFRISRVYVGENSSLWRGN